MLVVAGSDDADALAKLAVMGTACIQKSAPVFAQPLVLLPHKPRRAMSLAWALDNPTANHSWAGFDTVTALPKSLGDAPCTWHSWEPAPGHAAAGGLRGLRKRALAQLYHQQKQMMENVYHKVWLGRMRMDVERVM